MPKLTRSVADMPPQMRLCCEHLCVGRSDAEIAGHLRLAVATVKAHLIAARKRSGTKDRGDLAQWCRSAGNVRLVASGAPLFDTITTTGLAGRQVEIRVDTALRALGERYPAKLLAEAARVRAILYPARHPAAPADATTGQPAASVGMLATDGQRPDIAR